MLFLALLLRERLSLVEAVVRRVGEGEATLQQLFKVSALAVFARPLLKAVLQRDLAVIGKLVHTLGAQHLQTARAEGFSRYLDALRRAGLVWSDRTLGAQLYQVSATFMGFLTLEPGFPEGRVPDAEVQADLLAETLGRALSPLEPPSAEAAEIAAAALQAYLRTELTLVHEHISAFEEVAR